MCYQLTTSTLMLSLVIVLAGCGKSKTTEGTTGGQNMTAQTDSQTIFPEVTFDSFEFKATQRDQPESVEQAKATLDAIDKLYNWSNIPAALNKDLTEDSVFQYVKAWKLLSGQIPHDIQWLKTLDGASVPGADKISTQQIDNKKKQMLDWLENRLPKQMADSAKHTRDFLKGSVAPDMWSYIEKAADCDMSDQTAVVNLLSRPDINQLRAEQIKKVDLAYAALTMFDEQMGHESDWATQRQSFREVVARYQEKLQQAADAILPPVDIGDAALAKIAAEVLADKKYKLPKAHRVIVNAPKKSFGKDHFTIDFGERTIEKSPYRWEEFQVATIEKEGDQYVLWYNTLLYYSVGPSTVPTQKWVLGPRHRSAPISEKNINK